MHALVGFSKAKEILDSYVSIIEKDKSLKCSFTNKCSNHNMKHVEGTRLHFPIKPKNFMAVFLIFLTLSIGLSSFLPSVHAAVTAITVTPTSGIVGQSVSVNGTIETANGVFNIFFDSTKVKNGTAIAGKFTTLFTLPQARNGTHVITLQDLTLNHNATQNFTVQTSYAISPLNLPVAPGQLQEGAVVQIKAQIFGGAPSASYQRNITVTTPTSAVYNASLQLIANQSGTAENTLYYPTDFTPAKRNTNYTGTYQLRIYKNVTTVGAQSSFFIGLTNATSYHRFDWVNIKAMNYTKLNEYANVTIAFGSEQVNKSRIQAINGEVTFNWQIPANASMGSYKVTVTSATSNGTVKTVPDVQNFTVPGFAINFFTLNLNMERVGGVNATVYQIDPLNVSKKVQVATGVTSSGGSVTYTLERGNYTMKAYWKNVQVNETALIQIQNTSSWNITCQLARLLLTTIDKKTGLSLPFIVFSLNMSYVTSNNVSRSETLNAITNTSATWVVNNQLIRANYTVSAYRAQQLFNKTTFQIPAGAKVFNENITCPAFNLTIHAEDARQATLSGYPIKIYEYAGGLYANATTDSSGNVTFSAAFGQYKIRLYNIGQTIVLNETLFTLVNASSLLLRSSIYHANLSVKVLGYLGQPIPNVRVKLEREGVAPLEVNTDSNGVAFFSNLTGGDSFVSVYLGGDIPSDTANVHIEGNTAVTISLGKYVSVLGIIMDTSQFAVLLTFIVFIIVFALFIVYQRRKLKTPATETTEKKT